jgi:hypothetical protein
LDIIAGCLLGIAIGTLVAFASRKMIGLRI